jgi:hypothetical protein
MRAKSSAGRKPTWDWVDKAPDEVPNNVSAETFLGFLVGAL